MNQLVTGGGGFLGSHLCDGLLDRGYEVVAVDNLLTGRRSNLATLEGRPGFAFLEHDVVAGIPVEGPVDAVLHFAALKHVRSDVTNGLGGVEIQAEDPDKAAAHWSKLLNLPVQDDIIRLEDDAEIRFTPIVVESYSTVSSRPRSMPSRGVSKPSGGAAKVSSFTAFVPSSARARPLNARQPSAARAHDIRRVIAHLLVSRQEERASLRSPPPRRPTGWRGASRSLAGR